HAQGETHLSVNPSNLFLIARSGSSAPALKVLDFGVASTMNAFASGIPSKARPTPGLRLLFPAYAAPAQLDRTAGNLGPWTDVYALALLMMEMLSDRLVMGEADSGAIVEHALDEQRRPTPQAHGLKLPSHVDRALARAAGLDLRTSARDVRRASPGNAASQRLPVARAARVALAAAAHARARPGALRDARRSERARRERRRTCPFLDGHVRPRGGQPEPPFLRAFGGDPAHGLRTTGRPRVTGAAPPPRHAVARRRVGASAGVVATGGAADTSSRAGVLGRSPSRRAVGERSHRAVAPAPPPPGRPPRPHRAPAIAEGRRRRAPGRGGP